MKKSDQLEVSLDRVQDIISKLDQQFSTVDVIKEYSGGYFSNQSTPAYYSINAQFGKLLKRNSSDLKIKEIDSSVKENDDLGNKTSTSLWQKTT